MMVSRFLFTVPEIVILLLAARYFFDVANHGSYLALAVVIVLGTFEFAGIGLLVNLGSLSDESVDFLRRCIQAQLNILISGGTGSGKTTLLNALSAAIPDNERIVTIEDAAELQLNQRHVLRLEARPPNIEGEGAIPIRDLVRNSLRMRPDRIIVGEVRGAEALDMLQAMNTGHDGSLSTVHANSARDALARIETMVLMAGYDLPVRAIRQQVSSAPSSCWAGGWRWYAPQSGSRFRSGCMTRSRPRPSSTPPS